ncbi:MAG: amidophosphoribosyltransferase [Bacteroidia bacterium]|nr:MAG: amidophosphoribosyltransferase [Bacteroidia bacterium]
MNWLYHFLDLIFPRTCITCQNPLLKAEKEVCLNCLNDLAFLYDFQNLKDNKTYYQIAGLVPIQGAFSGFHFDKGGKLQAILHQLKYNHKPELGTILGEFLATQLEKCPFPPHTIIIPIPLHKDKLKKRGYNQTLYIAKGLANIWNLSINEKDFIRTKYTETQTFKSKEERQKNVENIFDLVNPIHCPVLVVDDVITTGSTLVSACKKLQEKGVPEIYVLTIASASS